MVNVDEIRDVAELAQAFPIPKTGFSILKQVNLPSTRAIQNPKRVNLPPAPPILPLTSEKQTKYPIPTSNTPTQKV